MSQGKFWLLTIPFEDWVVPSELPANILYMKGQVEIGSESTDRNPHGYRHWQFVVAFKKKVRPRTVKECFGSTANVILTVSKKANEYVWKDETAVPDTRFELGTLPFQRNNKDHWQQIREQAIAGHLLDIDPQVYVCHYNSLKRIAVDNMRPEMVTRETVVYWGPTGTGKSRRAWEEAGIDAYPKDPRSKFWDGYAGQERVVIDEFDGSVDICHMLRWLDRYPVIVEIKGSSCVFKAKNIWITSNINPRLWYPSATEEQVAALHRRIRIYEFPLAMRPVDGVYSTPRFLEPSAQELEELLRGTPCPLGVRY